MFNVIGASSQTLTHALTLANLASNSNPFAALGSIFLSRYVTGFGYSKTKVDTDRKEKVPHQSEIKVGVLRITNDRTHLEGIWDVDQGTIHTGKFTTASPKNTVEQKTKVSGWSVSLSPAALLGTGIRISPLSSAILPNISSNRFAETNIFSSCFRLRYTFVCFLNLGGMGPSLFFQTQFVLFSVFSTLLKKVQKVELT